MRIVADQNIPLLDAYFGALGTITALPGREITPADVRDADVLLVRSVTRVNQQLLEGSQVRFVATATSGTDHVDTAWLASQGIGFSSAAGCNAEAVADYVLAALELLSREQGFTLTARTVGIVGYGQIGTRLYRRLQAMGIRCLACDPFKQTPGGEQSLDEIIDQVDVLTFHTPLTRDGDHPTYHLLNENNLPRLGNGGIVINAGRGEVVAGQALKPQLQQGRLTAVLDVWENEPELDPELLEQVAIGTPHIAGYTLDGKIRGTAMVYDALCQWLKQKPKIASQSLLPKAVPAEVVLPADVSAAVAAEQTIAAVYDIRRDDQDLRHIVEQYPASVSQQFDLLRKHYAQRREFGTLQINLQHCPEQVQKLVRGMGFQLTGS